MQINLNTNWSCTFRHWNTLEETTIAATVPGNIELDLKTAGLIDEYWPADMLFALAALERTDWNYHCEFDMPEDWEHQNRWKLLFDGIDTIADVFCNGKKILFCDNMFIGHEADVTDIVQQRGNRLDVRIQPAAEYVQQFGLPVAFMGFHPHQAYLRKPRHAWGWDNAPALPTAGIWREVRLESIPAARLTEIYWYTQKADATNALLGLNWSISLPDKDLRKYRLRVTGNFHGQEVFRGEYPIIHTAGYLREQINIAAPHLWWPYGYGQPDLYDFRLELLCHGEVVDCHEQRIGIRVIELKRTEWIDSDGHGEFQFYCNGQRVFARGTNWKPLDALPSQAKGKISKALQLAMDCHCNMIRVWGGGYYEDQEFYDWCDEHGLLVWQDFMFACEYPPQDEWFLKHVAKEAEWVVKRLRNHASLALWSGDNEIDSCFFTGNIPPKLSPADNRISREILKQAVKRNDPWRDYLESSPYVSEKIFREWSRPGGKNIPCKKSPEWHLYPVEGDIRQNMRRCGALFISETGPFFINAMSETEEFVARELPRAKRLWNTPSEKVPQEGWRHQADNYFCYWRDGVKRCLKDFFGETMIPTPERPRELIEAVNIFCADTFKFAIEFSRVRKWRKTGVLWWSLIDMWPMMFNYSVVDYAFMPKKPFYWIRQSQQPVCLIGDEQEDGTIRLVAVNDTLQKVNGRFRLAYWLENKPIQPYFESEFHIEANGTTQLDVDSAEIQRHGLHWIEWDYAQGNGMNHFIAGKAPFDFSEYAKWDAFLMAKIRK